MSKKKKKTNGLLDYIKANRKGSREAEIENHSHPISHNRVHVSKKVYNRKRNKADYKGDLPYFFVISPNNSGTDYTGYTVLYS